MVSTAVELFESVSLSVLSELWKCFSRVGCMPIRVTYFIVFSRVGCMPIRVTDFIVFARVGCMPIRVTYIIVLPDGLWKLLSHVRCMLIKVLSSCLMDCGNCHLT